MSFALMMAFDVSPMKWLLIALALGISFHSSSNAAQILERPSKACAIRLVGELIPGDYDKLKRSASRLSLDDKNAEGELENTYEEALCLNSPGGSYLEGRRIAEFVHENAVPTRVEAGDECYSSCAMIFLAGRVRGDEFDNPARTLNVAGKLGFHAPYWKFDKHQTFSAGEVEELARLQNLIMSDFIRFGSFASVFSYRPDVSPSLWGEMLAAGPEQIALVDTVEKAARWGVDLGGFEYKKKIRKEDAVRLCVNFQAWSRDQSAVSKNYEQTVRDLMQMTREESVEINGKRTQFLVIDTGGYAAQFCQVEIQDEATEMQQICVKDDFSGRHLGDCSQNAGFWVPTYYSQPPGTSLSAIK